MRWPVFPVAMCVYWDIPRINASIILCEYYQCITVDCWCCSVLFACVRVYKRSHEFISWHLVLSVLGCIHSVACGSYTGSHTLSTHVYLWIFPSCFAWQPVSSVVGLRASWLPQCAPRVNVNSTKVYPLRSCLPCVKLGWVSFWHRGRGLTCVNYSCSYSCTPEGEFGKEIGTIHVTYVLPSALFYLVFTLCWHKCTKCLATLAL